MEEGKGQRRRGPEPAACMVMAAGRTAFVFLELGWGVTEVVVARHNPKVRERKLASTYLEFGDGLEETRAGFRIRIVSSVGGEAGLLRRARSRIETRREARFW